MSKTGKASAGFYLMAVISRLVFGENIIELTLVFIALVLMVRAIRLKS
jgi:hypothetical protein